MKRYMVAFTNIAPQRKTYAGDQVRTFDAKADALKFVTGVVNSEKRKLISVAHHDFINHTTIPLELYLGENSKLDFKEVRGDS